MFNNILEKDFNNIYKVYLDNLKRKGELFKFLVYFAISPYLVLVALLGVKAVSFSQFTTFNQLPPLLNFIITIIGIGIFFPLYQYVEYDDNVMRCARAINNFRTLYTTELEATTKWKSNLPLTPTYPRERSFGSSGTFTFIIFSVIGIIYIIIGIMGLVGVPIISIIPLLSVGIGECTIILFYIKTRVNPNYEPSSTIAQGFFISGSTLGETWVKYLKYVYTNGTMVQDDKGNIIEAPFVVIWPETIRKNDRIIRKFGKSAVIELYEKKMFSLEVIPELGTTYGDRLFDYNGLNQLDWVEKKIKESPWTKSATITLLDPVQDESKHRIPCLTTIDFKLRNGRLNLYVFFRSQDALNSYGNFIGLQSIQKYLIKKMKIMSGDIILFVISPHIYNKDAQYVELVIKSRENPRM